MNMGVLGFTAFFFDKKECVHVTVTVRFFWGLPPSPPPLCSLGRRLRNVDPIPLGGGVQPAILFPAGPHFFPSPPPGGDGVALVWSDGAG